MMLKNIAERAAREELESQRRRDVDLRTKSDAGQALRLQMLEKQAQKDLDRRNDALFAENAASQVNYMNDLDRQASMKK